MRKSTKAETLQRVRAVYELLMADTPRPDIIQYAIKNWEVSSFQTDKYIFAANKLISTEAKRLQTNSFEQHLSKRAALRYKALKDGDKRLAFEILRDEAKLLGLYPEKKVEITWREKTPDGYNADEVQRQFAELMTIAQVKND